MAFLISLHKKRTTAVFLKKAFLLQHCFRTHCSGNGGSMMFGTCEEAIRVELYGLLYVVGISIGFLLLGFGFAAKMKAMNVESSIDLFEIKYRSPLIRICASILSIITTGVCSRADCCS